MEKRALLTSTMYITVQGTEGSALSIYGLIHMSQRCEWAVSSQSSLRERHVHLHIVVPPQTIIYSSQLNLFVMCIGFVLCKMNNHKPRLSHCVQCTPVPNCNNWFFFPKHYSGSNRVHWSIMVMAGMDSRAGPMYSSRICLLTLLVLLDNISW
jgi:hypothetical protein